MQLTSAQNPRVKELLALRRRRSRERTEMTLIEGYDELRLALEAGVRPRTLYHCPELATADQRVAIMALVAGRDVEVIELGRPIFERVAYRESPDGWLAVVPPVDTALAHLRLGATSLLLICEGVEKPGNLGAILRTADAAGVAAVVAAGPVTDWGNPNVVRASKGTVFCVPVASAPTGEVLEWLAKHAVPIVATTPDTSTLLSDVDLTGSMAIAVGSEKYGLSPDVLAHAAVRVRIPMFGRADSLNVATSAAIVTYEAVRQRMLRG